MKREIQTWAWYFVFAFMAEMAGFAGWLGEMTKDGSAFQLSAAFWNYETPRFNYWLTAFLVLSAARLGVIFLLKRVEQ